MSASFSFAAFFNAERAQVFEPWFTQVCAKHELDPQTLRVASSDASARRYFRVNANKQTTYIVMDAPVDLVHDSASFVRVAKLMQEAHLHVPEVLDWDQVHGFMLLSDLGEHTVLQSIHQGANPEHYFRQAIEPLVQWQKASKPQVLPAYDAALLWREVNLFQTWYLEQFCKHTLSEQDQGRLQQTLQTLIDTNLKEPCVYVHRDFMPRNLIVGSNPDAPLGVLDFQDAVYGPITYDIASLMRDAFISWDEDFVLDITVRYWQAAQQAGLPVNSDFGTFYQAVEWMGLQRHLKVLGIFARLTLRDGKPKYLADTPRFVNYVRQTASRYSALKPLLRIMDQVADVAVPVA